MYALYAVLRRLASGRYSLHLRASESYPCSTKCSIVVIVIAMPYARHIFLQLQLDNFFFPTFSFFVCSENPVVRAVRIIVWLWVVMCMHREVVYAVRNNWAREWRQSSNARRTFDLIAPVAGAVLPLIQLLVGKTQKKKTDAPGIWEFSQRGTV
ncbi:hypothetical protein VTN77DRAFT_5221 [Rasamsonia byssochlamydoides]|uniref:uncharacterized protein n=1 Tax=Rasamsonia byssochlamydoides TaxID=89139 RepID=UPI0037427E85